MFRYTKAICRAIPRSIVTEGLRMNPHHEPLDYELACQQYQKYIEILKEAGIKVHLIEKDESLPDCVFVEDIAVIIDNKALLTTPGSISRRQEVVEMKRVLESDVDLKIKEMSCEATLDGGDVLFTGREIFVGQSSRTNKQGLEILKDFFLDYPVHGINVGVNTLHLKSMMTMCYNDTIICGNDNDSQHALAALLEKAEFEYDVIKVPDTQAANCVFVNGHLICRLPEEFPESIPKLDKLPVEKKYMSWSELSKVDGCFTCACILY